MAVSVWAAVGGMAAALGPPLGGLLAHLSWRWVFLVNVPVGVLALVAGPRVLRESREAGSGMPDLAGAVGLAAGVGALAWALVSAPDHGWGSPPVLVGLAVALICVVAVVLRSVRHPVPLLDVPALRVPTLWLSCLAMLLFATAFSGMMFGNVLFLTELWREPVIVAGLWLAPGPLMVVVVSLTVGGRLVNRLGPVDDHHRAADRDRARHRGGRPDLRRDARHRRVSAWVDLRRCSGAGQRAGRVCDRGPPELR